MFPVKARPFMDSGYWSKTAHSGQKRGGTRKGATNIDMETYIFRYSKHALLQSNNWVKGFELIATERQNRKREVGIFFHPREDQRVTRENDSCDLIHHRLNFSCQDHRRRERHFWSVFVLRSKGYLMCESVFLTPTCRQPLRQPTKNYDLLAFGLRQVVTWTLDWPHSSITDLSHDL